jgi:hypothetical protein
LPAFRRPPSTGSWTNPLALHRITHGLPLTLAGADLSQIAEGIVRELREEDPARPAEVRIDPGMSVQCDPALMAIALRSAMPGNSRRRNR